MLQWKARITWLDSTSVCLAGITQISIVRMNLYTKTHSIQILLRKQFCGGLKIILGWAQRITRQKGQFDFQSLMVFPWFWITLKKIMNQKSIWSSWLMSDLGSKTLRTSFQIVRNIQWSLMKENVLSELLHSTTPILHVIVTFNSLLLSASDFIYLI